MNTTDLPDWTRSSRTLHRAVEIAGPLHKVLFEPRPNYLHLPMQVQPWGLASPTFPNGAVLGVDFTQGVLRYTPAAGAELLLRLGEHTQASLFDALLLVLKEDGLGKLLRGVDGHLPEGGFDADEPLVLDQETATRYAELQYAAFTGIARFRTALEGTMTPVIVWPHHMDISTLWFHPSNPEMDESGPHLNFGLAPFTSGQFEMPYLYAYAHPYPEPFEAPDLPFPARWHTDGWRGVVVTFDALPGTGEGAAAFVEEVFAGVFTSLAPLLDQPPLTDLSSR